MTVGKCMETVINISGETGETMNNEDSAYWTVCEVEAYPLVICYIAIV